MKKHFAGEKLLKPSWKITINVTRLGALCPPRRERGMVKDAR